MPPSPSPSRLSSVAIVRVAAGLSAAARREVLDAEEAARLRRVTGAARALREALGAGREASDDAPSVGKIVQRLDRVWSVLRNVLRELARLGAESPLGAEAASVLRRYFPDGLGFLDASAQLGIRHARVLAATLAEVPFSPALGAVLAPMVAELQAGLGPLARALDARLVAPPKEPLLRPLRAAAQGALRAYVAYVEVMASAPRAIERKSRLLAPLVNVAAASRRREGARRSKSAAPRTLRARPSGTAPRAPDSPLCHAHPSRPTADRSREPETDRERPRAPDRSAVPAPFG